MSMIFVNISEGLYQVIQRLRNGSLWLINSILINRNRLSRLVSESCGIKYDLGIKGKRGILKSMKSRAEFLRNKDHAIRFVYTPKHCSWLNQVEIRFGILTKKIIKRGNFTSQKDLKSKLLNFIDYFNETMAKPYKWTFNGLPLKA